MSNLFNNPDNLVDVVRQILSGKPLEEKVKKKEEELDPVGKEDGDIDNDGDTDASDKYLKKRRKAISKAINEKDPKKKINASHCEEVELDEENLEENAAAIAKLKKAYEPLRGKKISPENAKRLNDIIKKFDNNKDMLMKIAKADIPFVSDSAITRLITKHNMKGAEIKAAMKEETFNEEKDDDGEEKTVAQKSDPDGDGKADGDGKKKPVKKKKKKEEGDDEKDNAEIGSNKPDVVDTKPSMETSSMVSEDEKELGKISKELDGASKTHKGQSDRIKAMIKKKEEMKEMNHDDNEKDTNLIMQLRKAVSLRGHTVNFKSGKEKVSQPEAQAFLKAFNKLKKPAEKEFMMKYAMKSKNDMKSATMGKYKKPGKGGLDLPKMKSEK